MLQSCPVRLVHRHAIPKCLLAACYQLPACSLLPALACLLPTCLLAACCLPTRLPALPASPSLLSYLPALPLYRPTPHLEISTYCYTRLRGPKTQRSCIVCRPGQDCSGQKHAARSDRRSATIVRHAAAAGPRAPRPRWPRRGPRKARSGWSQERPGQNPKVAQQLLHEAKHRLYHCQEHVREVHQTVLSHRSLSQRSLVIDAAAAGVAAAAAAAAAAAMINVALRRHLPEGGAVGLDGGAVEPFRLLPS